jgi:two-component system, chemotaxis family, CheB/CheR fusion protein
MADDDPSGADGADPPELTSLLEHIRSARGFDFSGYKRASLERRISKRLEALGIDGYGDYQDYLEVNPDEFTDLFDTLLINVTGFYRDEPAWEYLQNDVIPKLIEDTPREQAIRVWSAACASGEEAYTTAMVLAEVLGEDEFRRRVKIYATDVDEKALLQARAAVYSRESVKPIPATLRDKYWEQGPTGFVFRPDLRRSVIFGRNDLVRDAPISRIDLLISRNALMYFTPETQGHILSHFNFSLNDAGYLFLGKSEMLLTHGELFKPYSLKWRVFKRVHRTGIRDRIGFMAPAFRVGEDGTAERYAQLRDGAADTGPIAQIVLDAGGYLALANQAARGMFGLGPADIGRPVQDLELSYRPVELRDGLARAADERRVVNLGRVEWLRRNEQRRMIEVEITPVRANGDKVLGCSVTFDDVTAEETLNEQFELSKRQLETAYEELQSTVEELETTNEELQSTNEELETTNEELQSTNEELETMNEELQSTNDELEAMNDEQRSRADEVDRLNMFLEGILGNLGVGVVVLDADHRVQLWNGSSADLWGLRGEEVDGRDFFSLDIGLPVGQARDAVRAAVGDGGTESTVTIPAVDRRGKAFECTVRALPLRTREGNSFGAILLMSGPDRQLPADGGDGSARR